MHLENAEVSYVVFEPARELTMSPGNNVELPAHCAVSGVAKPSGDSFIRFALWLPVHEKWNEKLQAVGNGGYRGQIPYLAMYQALARGYAALGGDTGHTTPIGEQPESLAFGNGHPERIRDWGDRSIHAVTMAAKPLAIAFEQGTIRHSYFVGCSTGGHQALTEAQRYPGDFDGIVAGAPGNNRTGLNEGFVWRFVVNNRDVQSRIPQSKLEMITRAAVNACDVTDGVADGVIADPHKCHFDPSSLQCKTGDAEDCLTAPQVRTLQALYAPAKDPASAKLIYPAWPVGSESGWGDYISGNAPARADYWKGWVFEDPNWSWSHINWTDLVVTATKKMSGLIDAVGSDLTKFESGGGKLIMYHGWADPIGNPDDTIATFDNIHKANQHADSFSRLYMVPGMGHCSGGAGTDHFDMVSAIDAWVDKGDAPSSIPASHVERGKVIRTRPLCPYPAQAVYKGSGDSNDAVNFTCRL